MAYNISREQLHKMAPFASSASLDKFLEPLNTSMNEFRINSPMRIASFLAQLIHESGSFHYVEEIADGSVYEGRKDLGNTQKGDGVKFKGRGLLQITGRSNYRDCGKALNLPLEEEPELLEEPLNACRSAAWFWNVHNLNSYADVGLFGKITYVINGGYNGATERAANYARCKKVLNCAI